MPHTDLVPPLTADRRVCIIVEITIEPFFLLTIGVQVVEACSVIAITKGRAFHLGSGKIANRCWEFKDGGIDADQEERAAAQPSSSSIMLYRSESEPEALRRRIPRAGHDCSDSNDAGGVNPAAALVATDAGGGPEGNRRRIL